MAAQPNLSGIARSVYVVAGLGLMAWGFFGVESAWLRLAAPVGGAILVIEGLIGY